jgi:hypothetical protein
MTTKNKMLNSAPKDEAPKKSLNVSTARQETAAEAAERIRKMRTANPIDGNKNRLPDIPPREGFVRRWVNDKPGRVNEFIARGWVLIPKDNSQVGKELEIGTGSCINVRVGRDADSGQELIAYAMEIPELILQEDLRAKEIANERRMAYIEQAAVGDTAPESGTLEIGKKQIESNFTPD